MDKKEISRRETFNLAKFGLLLAAGLGVVEESTAKSEHAPPGSAFEPGALYVKLFKCNPDGNTFTMVKTISLPAVQSKQLLGDSSAQFTLKFWRPAGGGKSEAEYGNLTGTLFKN